MRVRVPGVRRRAAPLLLSFSGQPVEAYPGETIAAALIAAGIWNFRTTRHGAPRGPFCGMGVCGECALSINGVTRRACLEPVREGLHIEPQVTPARVPEESLFSSPRWEPLHTQVLIVGAGPAGLAAARAAAACNADVLVVDERAKAGGQYYKQPGDGFEIEEVALDAQFREGRALYAATVAAGVRFLFGATVWGAFGSDGLAIAHGERMLLIHADRIILASGAYELALPVPGWTLPGVVTTGAAQTLLRAYQVAPGKRILVAGHGPLNLQVAHELVRAGVDVVAVAELADSPGLQHASTLMRMLITAPSLVFAGLEHVFALRRRGVPILYGHALASTSGTKRVERATIVRIERTGQLLPGTERSYEVDAVCMGYGFAPQSELARALGCRHIYDSKRGSPVAERDADARSSVPHVFIAGDAGGLGGAKLALAQGVRAGVAAAEDLGLTITPAAQAQLSAALILGRRHARFQAALWRIYDAPALRLPLAGRETLLCRCEEVDSQSLERCLEDGLGSLGAIKRATRAGMGRCQARYCSVFIAAMAREAGVALPGDSGFFAPRTPFKPVPIGQLAGTVPPSSTEHS